MSFAVVIWWREKQTICVVCQHRHGQQLILLLSGAGQAFMVGNQAFSEITLPFCLIILILPSESNNCPWCLTPQSQGTGGLVRLYCLGRTFLQILIRWTPTPSTAQERSALMRLSIPSPNRRSWKAKNLTCKYAKARFTVKIALCKANSEYLYHNHANLHICDNIRSVTGNDITIIINNNSQLLLSLLICTGPHWKIC